MCITRHQQALNIEHHTDVQSAAMAVVPLQAMCRCLLTARIGACLPLAHLMHFSPKVTPACRRASRCGCCHSCCPKGQLRHSFLPKGQPPPMPARDGFLASSSLSCSTRSRSLPFTFDGIFTRTCTWARERVGRLLGLPGFTEEALMCVAHHEAAPTSRIVLTAAFPPCTSAGGQETRQQMVLGSPDAENSTGWT